MNGPADRAPDAGLNAEGSDRPLFRRVLGSAFDALPARVRQLHDGAGTRRWTGTAQVRRGTGVPARLLAVLIGLPDAAAALPVTVTLAPQAGGERWTRNFGGRVFASTLSLGAGRDRHRLVERFGIARFALALVLDGERLYFVPRRWSVLGIPMPGWLLPSGRSFETEIDGRFGFDITFEAPLVGLVAAYRGTLEPEAGALREGVPASAFASSP